MRTPRRVTFAILVALAVWEPAWGQSPEPNPARARRDLERAKRELAESEAEGLRLRQRNAQRKAYLESHPDLPAAIRKGLEECRPVVGMTKEMVLMCLGDPERTKTVATVAGTQETLTWDYGRDIGSKTVQVDEAGKVTGVEVVKGKIER